MQPIFGRHSMTFAGLIFVVLGGVNLASTGTIRFLELINTVDAAAPPSAGQTVERVRTILFEAPGTWEAWYLRHSLESIVPLSDAERELLESIRPASHREPIRTLLAYLSAPKSGRPMLAANLVRRFPESGLAHAIHGASLFDVGETARALAEASRALEIDPDNFVAARVELDALTRLQRDGELGRRACELLPVFADNPTIAGDALTHCSPVDPAVRLSAFLPVLARGNAENRLRGLRGTLRNLEQQPPPPGYWDRILAALKPADTAWWDQASLLAINMRHFPAGVDAEAAASFFARLLPEATATATPRMRAAIAEEVSLTLADFTERAGSRAAAFTALETWALQVEPLRRERHYRRLVELAHPASDGADRYAMLGRALAHPAAALNDDGVDPAVAGLFPHLGTVTGQDVMGTPLELHPPDDHLRLFFFWSTRCGFSKREARQIVAALADPESPLSLAGVEVIWIHRETEAPDLAHIRTVAAELGLDPFATMVAARDAAGGVLEERLQVRASPWVFLQLPDGRIVLDVKGSGRTGWPDRVAQIAYNMQTAALARLADRGER